jgi:hypothetical protein
MLTRNLCHRGIHSGVTVFEVSLRCTSESNLDGGGSHSGGGASINGVEITSSRSSPLATHLQAFDQAQENGEDKEKMEPNNQRCPTGWKDTKEKQRHTH